MIPSKILLAVSGFTLLGEKVADFYATYPGYLSGMVLGIAAILVASIWSAQKNTRP
tara:strand:+ start:750 stop:917 length:168 start_codon:yes stop_codon:yes gene_type:complete